MSNDHVTPSLFDIETLVDRNRDWAKRLSAAQPKLFRSLAGTQSPQILWIGCSDSRAPETSLLDLLPGDVFVHRNIANVLPYGDMSSLSVIQYAVEHLKVRHIIVCGHYNCGGVKAALSDNKLDGILDNWIRYIRDVRARHKAELGAIEDADKRLSRLIELNVITQVYHLKRLAIVRKAIKQGLQVHGLVYGVGTGHAEILEVPEDPDAEYYGN